MNQGGDAAEQVLRMSLNGVEVTAKITGEAAKQIAVLLYTLLKQKNKTKGRMVLKNMLRSGKELRMFSLRKTDLKRFCEEAKHYGIVYSVIRSPKATDGLVELMVRAEDAARLNVIFERFHLAKVDLAQIATELEKTIATKEEAKAPTISGQAADTLVESLLGTDAATTENPMKAQENSLRQTAKQRMPARSSTARTQNGLTRETSQMKNESPSGQFSTTSGKEQTSSVEQTRSSVRKKLAAISEKHNNTEPARLNRIAPVQATKQKPQKQKGR